MSTWEDAVRQEIRRYERRTGRDIVTRDTILEQASHRFRTEFPNTDPERRLGIVLQGLRGRGELNPICEGTDRIGNLATGSEDLTVLSATQRAILEQWRTVVQRHAGGYSYGLFEGYQLSAIREAVEKFVSDPDRESFDDLWGYLHAAQGPDRSDQVYDRWTADNRTGEELAALIDEIVAASEYDPDWETQLGMKRPLWELYSLLHFERVPLVNPSTERGLAFFGYPRPRSFEQAQTYVADFKIDYTEIVGQASAETKHEIPVELEIDQLLTIVDRVEPGQRTEDHPPEVIDLYDRVLADRGRTRRPLELLDLNYLVGRVEFYWAAPEVFDNDEWGDISSDVALEVPVDDRPRWDLTRLEVEDIVFHYAEGRLVGYSRVIGLPELVERDNVEHYKVDVELTQLDEPLPKQDLERYLLGTSTDIDALPFSFTPKEGYLHTFPVTGTRRLVDGLLERAGINIGDSALQRLQERLWLDHISLELPNNLYFDDEEDLRQQIAGSIVAGKNLIFTGPPGTGKTKLARSVCDQYRETDGVDDYVFSTATAEWTAYDTIGGYMPARQANRGDLEFQPGQFLRCFRDDEEIVNRWLVIDEINRADIDKAFGQLFSVLSGDSVELPYERERPIRIAWVDEDADEAQLRRIASDPDRYPVTSGWRLLATMNTADKTSLYEMSYAFMRRFNFVHVGIPDLTTDRSQTEVRASLLNPRGEDNYATAWLSETIRQELHAVDDPKAADVPLMAMVLAAHFDEIAVLWYNINKKREIGPAIVEEIVEFIANYGGDQNYDTEDLESALTNAVVSLVFPQLEGLRPDELKQLVKTLDAGAEVDTRPGEQISPSINTERLKRKASDMFDVAFEDDE